MTLTLTRRPSTRRRVAAAATTVLAIAGLAWTGTVVAPAVAAGTGPGPTVVYRCGQVVEQYHPGPHGEVTLVTANGDISFPDLGSLKIYSQQTGICRVTP